MNIIIPIGGKGERFINAGYEVKKPLINILGKQMIYYVLDNLNFTNNDNIYIIYYDIDEKIFNNLIKCKYPNINLIRINYQTKGATETIYEGLKTIINLTNIKKTMILDCDTFYTEDVITLYRDTEENAVFYVINKDINPIYSYITIDESGVINKIVEKVKISDYANTGIYCFNDIDVLFKYSKFIVENNLVFNNECYTSCIIDKMITDNNIIIGINLDNKYVFNLGTPEQMQNYINNTYIFLFDLDGTLVTTEDIYFNVWKEVLTYYGFNLTKEIYDRCISGNNDETAINNLNLNNILINEISQKKDDLFIKKIDNVKLINGVEKCLTEIKKNGHKLAVVTNCNRQVCESILYFTKLSKYFEFIIIGNECNNPKPFPDPYKNAIQKFNGNNEKTIIFEDSKTGLLSANSVFPKCIVGLETIYTTNELLSCNANITIKDYSNFNFHDVIYYNLNVNLLKKYVIQSINLDIKTVSINNTKVKGGFISDVVELKIETTQNNLLECIVKLENTNKNFLTEMSNNLDLYNREYYFYDEISKHVPIKIPEFYGLIKNNNKNIGILLKNINNPNYKLNLNLNNENISVSFSVIDTLVKLHSKFWGKNLSIFKYLKKNNDKIFNPFWNDFIKSKWQQFKFNWQFVLSREQLNIGEHIVNNFSSIQQKLSDKNLTFCHGDVKSPNIFYKIIDNNSFEPYLIDWQYIVNGKGVQDLVFFMIESFEYDKMKLYKNLFKEYYYTKLLENNINYLRCDYDNDFINASYYFPFFVAIWFGTISTDELIDKNFPLEYIKKLFNFYII